jgi:hypothetical protein
MEFDRELRGETQEFRRREFMLRIEVGDIMGNPLSLFRTIALGGVSRRVARCYAVFARTFAARV